MLKTIKIIFLSVAIACIFLPTACFAQVTIVSEPDVFYDQTKAVMNSAALTEEFMESTFGIRLESDVMIYIYEGENEEQSRISGNASPGKIILWLKNSDSSYKACFLAAHELTHQYQMEQVGRNTLDKNMWFTEGMADVIGVQVANNYDKSKFRDFFRSAARKSKKTSLRLSWIERKIPWNEAYKKGVPVYSKADFAMIYLISKYPQQMMWSYLYTLMDENTTPNDAMKATYGITSDEFDNILG